MSLQDPTLLKDGLRKALEKLPSIKLAVLFGSHARGTAHRRSDVDIGVLLDPYDPGGFWEIDLAACGVVGGPVDLVDLFKAPALLRFEVTRDGELLFERDEHAWVDFKAQAMIDWWDWAPTARMIHRITAEKLREEVAEHGSA